MRQEKREKDRERKIKRHTDKRKTSAYLDESLLILFHVLVRCRF